MEFLDPRFALLGVGVAAVTSERVRKGVGRGIGYVAAGAITAAGTVAHAGQEIFDEAREVASHNNSTGKATKPTKKSATGA